MSELRSPKRRTQKTKKWVKWALGILVFLFIAVMAGGAYVFYQAYEAAQESYSDLEREDGKSDLREEAVTTGEDPITILLIGVEGYSSGGENERADTQIVITLNPNTNQLTMTSIPRDTRVYMEKVPESIRAGYHKINAAYTYGSMLEDYTGNKLTVETVENLLNIPVDEYVTVNFNGFRDIVNVLGGVTVDVKKPFWEKDFFNNDKRIYFEEGEQHLSGEESLAFVRMRKRKVNNVYARDERQRQFIRAAIREMASAGTIFKANKISDILGENVETSLTASEVYSLQKVYSSIESDSIRTLKVDGANQYIDGISYFIPAEGALDEVSSKLQKALDMPVKH
ncbi:LCP family protein [Virgibacillus sp. W0181]|uniref:LCP family protein n=1 Tax=Virgibacillus sp. W0181 TaxID=3391581 RepID=UPI003F45010A